MTRHLLTFLAVGLGGALGSMLRFGLSAAARRLTLGFPYGTLAANLLGCLVIGAITALVASGRLVSPTARFFLAAGFCGGFTTLSAFVYELAQYVRAQQPLLAAGYLALTLAGSLGAFWLGSALPRMLARG